MWSAEEQTMVDLIKLAGYGVEPEINKDYVAIHIYLPTTGGPLVYKADTEYEAIRKAFNSWNRYHNGKN